MNAIDMMTMVKNNHIEQINIIVYNLKNKNKSFLKGSVNYYDDNTEGFYIPKLCFINAYINKYYTFNYLNLKIVGGTLSFDGWEEYGGSNRTMKEWLQQPTDIHYWLEDDEGNIYDYLFPWYNYCAKTHNRYADFDNGELYEVSKEEIKNKYKIEYIPAPEIVYKTVFKKITGFNIDENVLLQ